jgi:hypothetical protein
LSLPRSARRDDHLMARGAEQDHGRERVEDDEALAHFGEKDHVRPQRAWMPRISRKSIRRRRATVHGVPLGCTQNGKSVFFGLFDAWRAAHKPASS